MKTLEWKQSSEKLYTFLGVLFGKSLYFVKQSKVK